MTVRSMAPWRPSEKRRRRNPFIYLSKRIIAEHRAVGTRGQGGQSPPHLRFWQIRKSYFNHGDFAYHITNRTPSAHPTPIFKPSYGPWVELSWLSRLPPPPHLLQGRRGGGNSKAGGFAGLPQDFSRYISKTWTFRWYWITTCPTFPLRIFVYSYGPVVRPKLPIFST